MIAFLVIVGVFVALVVGTAVWAINERARVRRRFASRRATLTRRIARRGIGS